MSYLLRCHATTKQGRLFLAGREGVQALGGAMRHTTVDARYKAFHGHGT